jgi:hypothetical protein
MRATTSGPTAEGRLQAASQQIASPVDARARRRIARLNAAPASAEADFEREPRVPDPSRFSIRNSRGQL